MNPAERLKTWAESVAQSWQGSLFTWVQTLVGKGFEQAIDSLEIPMRLKLKPTLERLRDTPGMPADIKVLLDEAARGETEGAPPVALIAGFSMMIGAAMGLSTSAYGWGSQQISALDSWQLLPLPEALKGYHRGTVTEVQLDEVLDKMGFHDWQWPLLKALSEERLDPMTISAIWLRDPTAYEHLWKDMSDQGFDQERIDVLKELTKVVPPLADMVRFADYSGFDPAVIAAWKEYYTAPSWIREPFALLGVSDDWANKYWFSHWRQPGRYELEEMLHRKIIDADAVKLAYKTMGYSDYWQDAMLARSYEPFTRVDVRRMHKLGLLDESELQRSYEDIGFDHEKAAKMVEFTLLYNADPEAAEQTPDDVIKAKERDLTKTDLLRGFRDGLLKEAEARTNLTAMGYDDADVEYYIVRVAYDIETSEIEKELDYYHDAYTRSIKTRTEVVTALGQLNLPSAHTDKLIREWDMEKEVKISRPTKAELLAFWRKAIITDAELRAELQAHGYTEKYIAWYIAKG